MAVGLLIPSGVSIIFMHVKTVVNGTVKSDSVLLSHPAHVQDVGYPSRIESHPTTSQQMSLLVCCLGPCIASDSEGDIYFMNLCE